MTISRCDISDQSYHAAAHALAAMILAVCDRDTSPPEFEHFHENDLDAVPDMLSRLGIMRPAPSRHEFIVDWTPADPLPIRRHAGEPTLDDLGTGLDFCARWYVPTAFQDFERERQAIIDAAVALGRGIRVGTDYIAEDTRETKIIEDYWASRTRMEKQVGEDGLYPPLAVKAKDEQ